MRHFIASVLIFLLLLMVIYPVFLFIMGSIPAIRFPNLAYNLGSYGHLYSRLREAHNFNNVDILFLGSSHAYRGFDVRVFQKYGFLAFNLGSSSQTPIQTQVLLGRYLNTLNPKLVVYAVSPGIFNVDGVESAVDIISNDVNDIRSVGMALKINHLKVYNTLIYGSIRELLGLNSNFIQPVRMEGNGYVDTYISGGYVEKSTESFYSGSEEEQQDTGMVFVKYQLKAFEKIISGLKNRGINYILVYAPVANYHADINDEFDGIMRQYGQYYNFNKILNLSNDSFYDASHLRQEYAELFSAKVAELILGEGLMPGINPDDGLFP